MDLVVFGASGDLARRLVYPALYRLDAAERLPALRITGYALEDWSEDRFRNHIRENLDRFVDDVDDEAWRRFERRLGYFSGDLEPDALKRLGERIEGPAAFYLALPPHVFSKAAEGLGRAGLNDESRGWRRLVVEKPFGEDLDSALRLDATVRRSWDEGQVFRIDHFLGKETVQNVMVFRFANRFLEPVLNSRHIAQVQITVAEDLGLEGRYRYYDGIGALRDMIQNHLMQLFTLIAIEPPSIWDPEVLRDHKVEVLKAVHPIPLDAVDRFAVRGRYVEGSLGGNRVPGYLDEEHIADDSNTETFAALKLLVDNWRWKGTPFYLRTGKRMASTKSEIALQFHAPPRRLFRETPIEQSERNWLVFGIKPAESVDLVAHAKRPGLDLEARKVVLHASYTKDGEPEFSAYEQLLLDVLEGDATPFLRFDAVAWAWRIIDPVLRAWRQGQPDDYAAGSDGPPSQRRILDQGHQWRSVDGSDD
jgi:glucose-6-phosphate 1-dehydrogenase